MRCRTARALLPLLLDNVLPVGEHLEVEEHFRECKGCACFRAQLESPLPSLPALPESILVQFRRELDASLSDRLCQLHQERRTRPLPRTVTVSRPWMWVYGMLLGTTTSVAAYGLFFIVDPSAFARELLGGAPVGPVSSTVTEYALEDWTHDLRDDELMPCTITSESLLEPVEAPSPRGAWTGPTNGARSYPQAIPTTAQLPFSRYNARSAP